MYLNLLLLVSLHSCLFLPIVLSATGGRLVKHGLKHVMKSKKIKHLIKTSPLVRVAEVVTNAANGDKNGDIKDDDSKPEETDSDGTHEKSRIEKHKNIAIEENDLKKEAEEPKVDETQPIKLTEPTHKKKHKKLNVIADKDTSSENEGEAESAHDKSKIILVEETKSESQGDAQVETDLKRKEIVAENTDIKQEGDKIKADDTVLIEKEPRELGYGKTKGVGAEDTISEGEETKSIGNEKKEHNHKKSKIVAVETTNSSDAREDNKNDETDPLKYESTQPEYKKAKDFAEKVPDSTQGQNSEGPNPSLQEAVALDMKQKDENTMLPYTNQEQLSYLYPSNSRGYRNSNENVNAHLQRPNSQEGSPLQNLNENRLSYDGPESKYPTADNQEHVYYHPKSRVEEQTQMFQQDYNQNVNYQQPMIPSVQGKSLYSNNLNSLYVDGLQMHQIRAPNENKESARSQNEYYDRQSFNSKRSNNLGEYTQPPNVYNANSRQQSFLRAIPESEGRLPDEAFDNSDFMTQNQRNPRAFKDFHGYDQNSRPMILSTSRDEQQYPASIPNNRKNFYMGDSQRNPAPGQNLDELGNFRRQRLPEANFYSSENRNSYYQPENTDPHMSSNYEPAQNQRRPTLVQANYPLDQSTDYRKNENLNYQKNQIFTDQKNYESSPADNMDSFNRQSEHQPNLMRVPGVSGSSGYGYPSQNTVPRMYKYGRFNHSSQRNSNSLSPI